MARKLWDVDIRFSPAVCIHGVEADSEEEAERIVKDKIASPEGLRLTTLQTKGLISDLFENVDEVECVGRTYIPRKRRKA